MPEVEGISISFITVLLALFSAGVGIWFIKTSRYILPRQGYLDPAITPTMAILLIISMVVLGVLGSLWGISQVPDGQIETLESVGKVMGPALLAQIPVLLAYAMLRKRCGSRHILPVSVTGFLVFVPLAITIATLFHEFFSKIGLEPSTILGHKTLLMLSQSQFDRSAWIVIICSTVGAGITEEVLYRGLLLPTFAAVFKGKTAWGAIVATSVVFALVHSEVATYSAMAGLFILSLGLCWARVKSGGVLAPIAIHVLFNAMNIAIVYSTNL